MTYIKIRNYCFLNGKWHHLIRAVNSNGQTVASVVCTNINAKLKAKGAR